MKLLLCFYYSIVSWQRWWLGRCETGETERQGWVCMSLGHWDKWGHRRGLIFSSLVFTPWRKRRRGRWRRGCLSTLVVNETSLRYSVFKWWERGAGAWVCLRSGWTRWRSRVLKKCLKEEGVQLQESKVTDEKEKEGGARQLSLERSVSPIERQGEMQVGEGRGGGIGAWVTDRSPRREFGSQHAAGMAGRQAAVIRIISCTAACSSAHRQILIGKISWDELQKSCAVSDSSVIAHTPGQLPEKCTVWVSECCTKWAGAKTRAQTQHNSSQKVKRLTFFYKALACDGLHRELQVMYEIGSVLCTFCWTLSKSYRVLETPLMWQHPMAACPDGWNRLWPCSESGWKKKKKVLVV